MSFWNSEKLIRTQHFQKLVEPFNEERVKHGAYELSMGSEAFLTSEPTGAKQELGDNGQLVIPPGQFGLLLTGETVAIPDDAIAFISIKFSIKQRGLVNVSGFHVDPGFKGQLKFAVYNAGSRNIVLTRGERVFIIWFCDLSATTRDGYDGQHAMQHGISSEDVMQIQGEVASPAALKKQIEELRADHDRRFSTLDDKMEQRFSTIEDKITTRTTIVAALLTALIVGVFFKGCDQTSPTSSNPPVQNTNQKAAEESNQRGTPDSERNTNSSSTSNNANIKPETR
jgi:dCTP deaminase